MIAVYINEEGVMASIHEKGLIRIYQLEQGVWKVLREIPFILDRTKGITEVRRKLIELIQGLKECRAFAAKEVAGQLYYVLEANGLEAFEAEGRPEEFLDSIQEAMENPESKKLEDPIAEPVSYIESTGKEGFYFLNLKKALNLDCGTSSKKLLLPFLRKREFQGLDMICDHLPRWLQTELEALKLKSEIIQLMENEYRVIIVNENG